MLPSSELSVPTRRSVSENEVIVSPSSSRSHYQMSLSPHNHHLHHHQHCHCLSATPTLKLNTQIHQRLIAEDADNRYRTNNNSNSNNPKASPPLSSESLTSSQYEVTSLQQYLLKASDSNSSLVSLPRTSCSVYTVMLVLIVFIVGCLVGISFTSTTPLISSSKSSLFGLTNTLASFRVRKISSFSPMRSLTNSTTHLSDSPVLDSPNTAASTSSLLISSPNVLAPHFDSPWCIHHPEACVHNTEQDELYRARQLRVATTAHPRHQCNISLSSPVKLYANDRRFEDWTWGKFARAQSWDTCPTPCALTTQHQEANVLIYVQSLDQGFHPLLSNQSSAVIIMEAFLGTAWKPPGFDISLLDRADYLITFDRRSDIWVNYFADLFGYNRREQWSCERQECFHEELIPFPILNNTHEAYSALYMSNCHHAYYRHIFYAELMKLIPIDSYGSCFHTPGLPEPDLSGGFDAMYPRKRMISRHYLFHFVVENWIKDDYVTEKFFQSLLLGIVPVYLGATNIAQYFPANHSVINIHDFNSTTDLVDYLKYLRQNPLEYEKWRDWRRQRPIVFNKDFLQLRHFSIGGWEEEHFGCRLCQKYQQRECINEIITTTTTTTATTTPTSIS